MSEIGTIYKYPLDMSAHLQTIEMPDGAAIVHVADQGGSEGFEASP